MSVIFPKVKSAVAQASDYVQGTKAYRALENLFEPLRPGAAKILDYVLPRNEMTNRREIRFIPISFEKWIGAAIYDNLCPRARISKDAELNARVKKVFDKLVEQCPRKNLDWEVRVLEDKEVVNAFCTPGGKVVITTALIKKMEEKYGFDAEFNNLSQDDNLAAVLGHEIVHAAAGHGARRIQLSILAYVAGKIASFVLSIFLFKKTDDTNHDENAKVDANRKAFSKGFDLVYSIASKLFVTNHSQSHELESDKYGIKLAHQAGYNINASIRLQHVFLAMKGKKDGDKSGKLDKVADLVNSHPPSQARLDANRHTVHDIKKLGVEVAFA